MMGEELNACQITEKGIKGDRAYAVIDLETGKVVNAKNPKRWPNIFRHHAHFTTEITELHDAPPIRIELPNGDIVESNDKNIGDTLTESFGRRVMLARPFDSSVRFIGDIPDDIKSLKEFDTFFTHTLPKQTFFDSGMVHVITTSTLEALHKLAPTSRIEARRFRPNLVIETPDVEGFVEDKWIGKTIAIGQEVQLKIVQQTKRCVMTTLEQGDLPKDPSVLRTLAQKNEGYFGVYAEIVTTGNVLIGDSVHI